MIHVFLSRVAAVAMALVCSITSIALAQGPKITSISVGPSYAVLGPDHATPINSYGGLSTTSDLANSWSNFSSSPPGSGGCIQNFNGWYPSLMSMGARPGHLSTQGYVFYMNGCTGKETTGGRAYSSRSFTIQAQ
jgi:hypothetical protein